MPPTCVGAGGRSALELGMTFPNRPHYIIVSWAGMTTYPSQTQLIVALG